MKQDYDSFGSKEEKCAFLYSFFSNTSKPEVAQQLSFILDCEYEGKSEELKDKLPPYIVDAIEYVTEKR